jgi:ABC-type Zn uptake system ZnuABC Zn-binding protein ZnuA
MITCIKHRINYEHGECPSCKRLREGISVSYSSNDPVHTSKYYTNLEEINKQVEKINARAKKLLQDIKDK